MHILIILDNKTKEKICIMCEDTEPHKMKIREIHCTECNTENCALKFRDYYCQLIRYFLVQSFLNKLYMKLNLKLTSQPGCPSELLFPKS